jgi:TraU protein.
MKHRRVLYAAALLILAAGSAHRPAQASGTCPGHFPNLISDICWDCVFPMSVGPATVTMGQQDAGDTPPLICTCPAPPPVFVRPGVGIGYWDPSRVSEVVRKPFCSPTLGGVTLAGFGAPGGTNSDSETETQMNAFYQVHWFTMPLLSWIGAAFTSATCASTGSFDLVYMTELDPMWNDDELTYLINPEAVLFTSLPAQGACIADSIAAATGFGLNSLFWCSGSQGSVYPIDGTIAHHIGGVDSSMLETHRMVFKLARELVELNTSTTSAMCSAQPMPILRKNQYKLTMLYPKPQTDHAVPFGRESATWDAGREYPYKGEDFTWLVWKKRLCCAF